jgi:uncharacterized phosphosugar-binding protein
MPLGSWIWRISETIKGEIMNKITASSFIQALDPVLRELEQTQEQNIAQAAQWVAEAISEERFGVLFGCGHSYMATSDTFPRIGSFPGWLPIHELATSYIANISGNMGLRQSMFLEQVEGFGDVVLANYRLDPRDVMIVISNSGVNPMGIDIAINAKQQGLKTVAITSLQHSKASESRHSNGKRLFEVCDLTIDTCVPQGDAMLGVEGFGAKIGAASTIMAAVVMQALAAETAQKLADMGISLPVYPSHNAKFSPEEHERVEKLAEDVMNEFTRRTSSIYK